MPPAFRLGLCLGDGARRNEVLVDLIVQLATIGHDDERPVPRHLAQHLLREVNHRDALPAPLRVPEDAETAPALPDLRQCCQRVGNPEILVVFC